MEIDVLATEVNNNKVKLENTGSHKDTYIPEVESTLEDNWSVSFWQDSGKTQSWPATGVDIEAGELDDLWVFVEVDDEADEGNYTIEISVRDEDDNPDAREEIGLTVIVQRPELTIDNIRLLFDEGEGNASMAKDGDTVVVLVGVENTGTADADDVRVEVFYYPKNAPTTQSEIDELIISGFVFDEAKDTYIYVLYDKVTNIESGNHKWITSNDWIIKGGEWYVEARADYDEDDSNGKILEPNENNNDARYGELLRIKPDLAIDELRVDSRFAGLTAKTPNIDDQVTFTATVTNKGAADVDNARLYITADSSDESGVIVQDRGIKDYVEFSIDAGATETIRFRWKAVSGEWTTFRAEVNPSCSDVSINIFDCEQQGDGDGWDTDHMYDELGRYSDNVYPAGGAIFEQDGYEVMFAILPDFIISDVYLVPPKPQIGEEVEVTARVSNTGNADWKIGSKLLSVVFEDGVGSTITTQVSSDINEGDEIEVKFTWTASKTSGNTSFLTFNIDAGSGSWEIRQISTANDVYIFTIEFRALTSPVAIADDWNSQKKVLPGEVVPFSGTGTDEDGNVVLYEWDFNGDGVYEWSSSESGSADFTFTNEGTYTAVLRVTDNDGLTATDSRVITVGDGGGDDGGGIPAPSLAAAVAAVAVIALRRPRKPITSGWC